MKSLEKVKKIKSEIANFTEILNDYEKRAKSDLVTDIDWKKRYNERNPNSPYTIPSDYDLYATKESAVLKSAYKVLKYKLDKLILQ